MHNARFDLMWMIEHCPDPEGTLMVRNIHDTMLKSQLVHDYRTRSGAQKAGRSHLWRPNDLQAVLDEQLGVSISKSIDHDTTDWTGPWSDEMLSYMLEDICYLEPLNDALQDKINTEEQDLACLIEQDAVLGTAYMALNGIKPDIPAWHEAIHGMRDDEGNLVLDEDGEPVHPGWKEQHRQALLELAAMWPGVENFASPKQLVAAAAKMTTVPPLRNTAKETLKPLRYDFPPIAKLLDQRHLATRLKNWGPHYLEKYVCAREDCQRFHPGWNQIGTETSRPSCNRPNLLQIPRESSFRKLFVADTGNLIASLDYSAIEVLVAGVFAKEPKLIKACATGDPHLATARMIARDDTIVKSDPRRQHAKIANFGLLFGGGRDGLITQAKTLFDTTLTIGEAEVMMAEYFRLYPGLQRTKSAAYEAMQVPEDRVTVTNGVKFRRYLDGFNKKPTSWLNTWIQSTAAYGMKRSFKYLNEARLTPFVLGQIYDEILFEFPEEHAQDFAAKAKACMIQGMKDVLGQHIPVVVDVQIGKSWL